MGFCPSGLLSVPHPGRPVTVAAPEMVNKVHDNVIADRQVTERNKLHSYKISCNLKAPSLSSTKTSNS